MLVQFNPLLKFYILCFEAWQCMIMSFKQREEKSNSNIKLNYNVQNVVSLLCRGQESAGIVTNDGKQFHQHKGMGLVNHIFQEQLIKSLPGHMGIGHTRYSTAGASELVNCQPFVVDTIHGHMAVGHNGELVNAKALRKKVLMQGTGLSTGSDSEVITQLLTATPPCGEPDGANWPGRIYQMMQLTQLSYSLVIMTQDCIYAVRDPHGNRPLCIGKLRNLNDSPELSRLGGEVIHSGYDSDCIDDSTLGWVCLLYTSPSPRDLSTSRMPSSA